MPVPPATQVLLLAALAWTAGTAVGGAATRSWGEVDAGHFKVIWLVTAALAGFAGLGFAFAWIVAVASLATFAAIYAGRDLPASIVTAAASVLALIGGTLEVRADPWTVAFAFAAATLLGGITNAMLLGHWHLNQPKLGTGPLRRLVRGLWAGIAAYLVATMVVGWAALQSGANIGIVAAVTAVCFTAFTGVLAAMVTHLVGTRSIMSATGILYLGLLLCFVAVFTGSLGALSV